MTMKASQHLRMPPSFLGRGTQGICGAGYPWPSGVLLTENVSEVTCHRCLEMIWGKEDENDAQLHS